MDRYIWFVNFIAFLILLTFLLKIQSNNAFIRGWKLDNLSNSNSATYVNENWVIKHFLRTIIRPSCRYTSTLLIVLLHLIFTEVNFHTLEKIRPPLFFKVSKLDQNLHFFSNDHFSSNKREHKSVICRVNKACMNT